MKVLAINGSPKSNGNTAFALKKVMEELEKNNIETEMVTIGQKEIRGCIGCGWCSAQQKTRCVFDDEVNELLPKMIEADGLLLGSPVYYSGINGTIKSFLDRAFFVAAGNGFKMRHKVGAALVAVRRSGGTASFDQLNKYFLISEMMVVGSCYWNIIHGLLPEEASQDLEGVSVMQTLGRNMAWVLQSLEKNREQQPQLAQRIMTNFVR